MRTLQFVPLLAALGIVVVACGGPEGVRPDDHGLGSPLVTLTVHGTIRSSTSLTPIAGATLGAFEITSASTPDIKLASATSGSDGSYSITFAVSCDKLYGVIVDYPDLAIDCSRCPIWPLPNDTCTGGDWPVDIGVQT